MVRNPFAGESDAFKFLLLLLAGLFPVAIAAAFGPPWLVLILLALAVAVAAARWLPRRGSELRLKSAPAHLGAADERRILVVANDTLGEEELVREIERLGSAPRTHVRVLAPGLVSRRARWTSAVDGPHEQARRRLNETLGHIREGIDATGEVSDADPLQAIEDTLASFAADEIIISTRREPPREGLEPRLARLAQERFALPVSHLVFEPDKRLTTHA
jgi:hypothetical protein